MSKINNGGAAFPRPGSVDPRQGTLPDGDSYVSDEDGMSLRDYFAAKAMQGMLASAYVQMLGKSHDAHAALDRTVSAAAFSIADAMLSARGK